VKLQPLENVLLAINDANKW